MLGKVYDIDTAPLSRRFTQLRQPPKRLYCRGDFLNERGLDHRAPIFGIVGTRKPSEVGRQIAHQLGFDIASMGGIVVSGGALGIDSAAHRGCIEGGGATYHRQLTSLYRGLIRDCFPEFSVQEEPLSEFEKPPRGKYAFAGTELSPRFVMY